MVQLLINSSKNHPFVGIADGNWTLYRVYDDFVTDANELALYDSNDVIHYGAFTLRRYLTEADIPNYPDFIRDVIPLLDSSAFACVRSDGTTMLDSPGRQPLAVCYARLTGRILQREGGYTQLQIGSEERGITGWFVENDLAYGRKSRLCAVAFRLTARMTVTAVIC